jgi:hypothetical protein
MTYLVPLKVTAPLDESDIRQVPRIELPSLQTSENVCAPFKVYVAMSTTRRHFDLTIQGRASVDLEERGLSRRIPDGAA